MSVSSLSVDHRNMYFFLPLNFELVRLFFCPFHPCPLVLCPFNTHASCPFDHFGATLIDPHVVVAITSDFCFAFPLLCRVAVLFALDVAQSPVIVHC